MVEDFHLDFKIIDELLKLKYLFFTIFILIAQFSHGRCFGFDHGDPYFCAKFQINDKVKADEDYCNVNAALIDFKFVGPEAVNFKEFEGDLKKGTVHLVQLPAKYCNNQIIIGKFEAVCHDVGKLEDIKKLPSLYMYESTFLERIFSSKKDINCPKFESK